MNSPGTGIDSKWERLQELFSRAVDLTPAERDAFVERETAGDPEFREELLNLLACDTGKSTGPLTTALGAALDATTRDRRRALLGKVVGNYKLTSVLGHGGTGTVYLGERADRQYSAQVAVKIVDSATVQGDLGMRFRAERQILASLNHPNIARLLDAGETEDGQPYLIMEYVHGEPVDRFCDRQQLDINARLQLFLEICGAVQYAHQNLIVHRDLKPANIFLSATPGGALHPVVLDFGIAKLVAAEPGMTRGGAFIGTPGYLAPEHIEGLAVDARADQYALGIILYECVTGRKAFDTSLSLPELAAALTSGDIMPIRDCAPDVPAELALIIERAISVARASRYDTLEELGLELSRFASAHVSDQWRRSLPVRGPRPPAKDLSPESTAPTKLGIATPALPVTQPVTAPPGDGGPVRSRVRPTNPTRRRAETPPTRRQCNPQAK
jgi:serine/threonine protein kinase